MATAYPARPRGASRFLILVFLLIGFLGCIDGNIDIVISLIIKHQVICHVANTYGIVIHLYRKK